MIETAHKLIISWGMTAGAWRRGSIKLKIENPGPGELELEHYFRFQSCWSWARTLFHLGPGKVGLCWCFFNIPPDSALFPAEETSHPVFVGVVSWIVGSPRRLSLVATVIILIMEVCAVLILAILLRLLLKFFRSVGCVLCDSLDSFLIFFWLHLMNLWCTLGLFFGASLDSG